MVSTAEEDKFAVLTIKDTGRGMPQDVVEKVFIPFYTTKIGGTGLGMVFVRQIVDEHRGVITIHSKVGRGTTVTIRLPHRFTDRPEIADEFPPVTPEAPTAPKIPKSPKLQPSIHLLNFPILCLLKLINLLLLLSRQL